MCRAMPTCERWSLRWRSSPPSPPPRTSWCDGQLFVPCLSVHSRVGASRTVGVLQRIVQLPLSRTKLPGGLTILRSPTQRIAALSDEGDSDASGGTGELRGWDADALDASAAAHHTDRHGSAADCPHSLHAETVTKRPAALTPDPLPHCGSVARSAILLAADALSDAESLASEEGEGSGFSDDDDEAWGPEMATPARGWRGASARRRLHTTAARTRRDRLRRSGSVQDGADRSCAGGEEVARDWNGADAEEGNTGALVRTVESPAVECHTIAWGRDALRESDVRLPR